MRRSRVVLFLTAVIVALSASPGHADAAAGPRIPGLRAASVVRDADGVAHIKAQNPHDLFFLQGWVHADDRLFQMDVRRRRGSGTLAELLGSSALPSDVQLRTFGLRRTAERSLRCCRRDPGGSARVRRRGERLDRTQQAAVAVRGVQVTKVAPWTVVDSLVVNKMLAFSLSFDLDIDRTTAVQATARPGSTATPRCSGTCSRSRRSTRVAGDRLHAAADAPRPADHRASSGTSGVSEAVARLAADYLDRAEQVPLIVEAMNRSADRGSNSWVIGGRHTATGQPILASDPHLARSPRRCNPIDLQGGGFNAQGDSLPGPRT